MDVIYLDNNATTKVAPEVVETMLPYLSEYYGNPSSMHSFGGNVAEKIKEARQSIANLIGASSNEIIFTSCGTESDGTAIRAAIESNPDKRHIVTSRVEHPAIKSLYETLSKKGYQVTFVPVDNDGHLDLDYLYNSLSDNTAIVSLMWANNETGVIFPVEEISREVKDRDILFPHRCRTGGRQNPDRCKNHRRGHAFANWSQISCPQRDRCALCSQRH